jgi:hypothetical protein
MYLIFQSLIFFILLCCSFYVRFHMFSISQVFFLEANDLSNQHMYELFK